MPSNHTLKSRTFDFAVAVFKATRNAGPNGAARIIRNRNAGARAYQGVANTAYRGERGGGNFRNLAEDRSGKSRDRTGSKSKK